MQNDKWFGVRKKEIDLSGFNVVIERAESETKLWDAIYVKIEY